MNRKKKPLIKLEVPGLQSFGCTSHEAHIDVVGAGSENYNCPDVNTLVQKSLAASDLQPKTVIGKVVKRARNRRTSRKSGDTHAKDAGAQQMLPTVTPLTVIPRLPNEPADRLYKTLLLGATGLQVNMVSRQLDGIVYDIFGTEIGTLNWASKNMPEQYRKGARSLQTQFDTIVPRFKQALLQLIRELAKRNPNVPQSQLLKHAVDLLLEQLGGFRFISKVYTDSFAQYRDGVYASELMAINFFYNQAAALFKRVDPDSPEKKAEGLESIIYQVGDNYLARFTSMSLATIPGSKGPIGIHALQMPFDFQDILAIMLPLLAHEFRHNLFADVKGLDDEMRAVLKAAIIADHKSGALKFGSEEMMLGEQKVPTRDLMVKLMVDSIGEIDADIAGGVLFDGTAYLYNMMLSFPAMLVRGTPLAKAKKLLRTESTYRLIKQEDGSHALVFEPHPPDYIRAYIVAAGLDEIGFKAEADECRRLADLAVGQPLPTHITWSDGGGDEHEEGEGEGKSEKSDMVIAFTVEDIKAVAPTVARAIIRAKLKSLGGRSTFEMVDWNAAREAKVQKLAQVLVAGGSEVPADIGSVYATYVGAAATLAYWQLLHAETDENADASAIARTVNANAMKMIHALEAKAGKTA
jgi:hypothetical protein